MTRQRAVSSTLVFVAAALAAAVLAGAHPVAKPAAHKPAPAAPLYK